MRPGAEPVCAVALAVGQDKGEPPAAVQRGLGRSLGGAATLLDAALALAVTLYVCTWQTSRLKASLVVTLVVALHPYTWHISKARGALGCHLGCCLVYP